MQLAIECASDEPGVALARDGEVVRAETWTTQQNHSVELLPAIDRLISESGQTKADVTAIFVDIGPGGYAALRVGVSVAKALAHGLGVPLAGIGRLELDAWAARGAGGGGRIVATHRAGRGEIAWAGYDGAGDGWREVEAPRTTAAEEMIAWLRAGDVVTGEIDDVLRQAAEGAGARVAATAMHRVVALAALGQRRLAAGRTDDPRALVPLYLRAPAVGPQKS